jgi:hypothetical protein
LVTDDAPFNLGSILAFMCFDLVSYFFLKLSKIDISENVENLQTADNKDERSSLSVLVSLHWSGRIEPEQ